MERFFFENKHHNSQAVDTHVYILHAAEILPHIWSMFDTKANLSDSFMQSNRRLTEEHTCTRTEQLVYLWHPNETNNICEWTGTDRPPDILHCVPFMYIISPMLLWTFRPGGPWCLSDLAHATWQERELRNWTSKAEVLLSSKEKSNVTSPLDSRWPFVD